MSQVLAINPGSTTTKFAVFNRGGAEWVKTIFHGDEELSRFSGQPILARKDYRAALIERELKAAGYYDAGRGAARFAAVAGRGGFLRPLPCGTYLVDDAMLEELRLARRGEHASNLGAFLAQKFARAAGVNAYIVDPVTVDEWQPCARLTGTPLVERTSILHALNTKAVARRFAREQGRAYNALRLIVAHMGSGITVSAHRDGCMIDSNTIEEGPFGPDRTGALPIKALIKLCFSGAYNEKQLQRMVFGEGGLFAYLGTRDLREVERRMDAGDPLATGVFEAMIYQIAKEAGALTAALEGKVDAIILTGGMAYSERLLSRLRGYIAWIAPIAVYPGEDELEALAEGVFRVLDGEEQARTLLAETSAAEPAHAHRERLVIGLE
jgi:butyrate kinase